LIKIANSATSICWWNAGIKLFLKNERNIRTTSSNSTQDTPVAASKILLLRDVNPGRWIGKMVS